MLDISNDSDFVAAAARISGLHQTATIGTLRPYAAEAETLQKKLQAYQDATGRRLIAEYGAKTHPELAQLATRYGGTPSDTRKRLTVLLVDHQWNKRTVSLADPVPGIFHRGAPFQPDATTLENWFARAEQASRRLGARAHALTEWPNRLREWRTQLEKDAFAIYQQVLPQLTPTDTRTTVQRLADHEDLDGVTLIARELLATAEEAHARKRWDTPGPSTLTLLSKLVKKHGATVLRKQAMQDMIEEALGQLEAGDSLETVAECAIEEWLRVTRDLQIPVLIPGEGSLESEARVAASRELLATTRLFQML